MSGSASLTNQFFNEMLKFSELVLARMALLIDQSHLVLPLQYKLKL